MAKFCKIALVSIVIQGRGICNMGQWAEDRKQRTENRGQKTEGRGRKDKTFFLFSVIYLLLFPCAKTERPFFS